MKIIQNFLLCLIWLYILMIWGYVHFIVWGTVALICYIYYRRKGYWPWTSMASAVVGKVVKSDIAESKPKITFADVAGIDEEIEDLRELVDFLKNRAKYVAAGARLPRGVLLAGGSGLGKTLSAKAVAGEAGVPFFSMAGSEFVEMYVGVGASRIRALFARAKAKAPCIVFIDEIDAIGRRGGGNSGGEHERDQTINQLLVEVDGFETKDGVVLIGATNRPDKVDDALLRPGRFDRKIYFNKPDLKGRIAILGVHIRNKKLSEDVDLKKIASAVPGFSGADLENLMNEAAICAARNHREIIFMNDIVFARDRVIYGKEKKSMVISEEDKRVTAYHEAGHALLALLLPNCDPPDKVTVIPRDMSLGLTSLVSKDRHNVSKAFLLDHVALLYGGRIAEKLACDVETAGAKNDIERATEIIKAMVCEYGMSDVLGPISVNMGSGSGGMGNLVFQEDAQKEIRRLALDCFERARKVLEEHSFELEKIALLLIEKETITGEEIVQLIQQPR